MINQSIKKVFDFIANPENKPLWNPSIKEIKRITGGTLGIGTNGIIIDQTFGFHREIKFTYDKFESPAKFLEHTKSSSAEAWFLCKCEREGNKTRLDVSVEVKPSGIVKIIKPIFVMSFKRQFVKDLSKLKELLESVQ